MQMMSWPPKARRQRRISKRHIRTLAAAVGVQFVENEKTQPLRSTHQLAVLAAGEQQFQHHVVGEQDVRRIAPNRLTLRPFFLPRVAGKANGRLAFRITLLKELLEFFVLAVGQGVHGINHDGLDASAGPMPQNVVNDRHDVGQALA